MKKWETKRLWADYERRKKGYEGSQRSAKYGGNAAFVGGLIMLVAKAWIAAIAFVWLAVCL